MSDQMPDPLVPEGVDLRGYEFMPLYGHRLFASDFNARVSDSAWRAAITLWWAAWNQVPAASLPNDDVVLTKLADLGRDLKAFRKIKTEALHGFFLCSDGRLYHRVLSGLALDAWARRVKERRRKADYRAKKESQNADGDGNVPAMSRALSQGQTMGHGRDVPAEGKGSEATGTGTGTELQKQLQPQQTTAAAARRGPRPTGAPSGETWDAYRLAYLTRYGIEPVRNAKVNAQLAQLVTRLGAEDAPKVAAYYVTHNSPWYVTKGHNVDALLADAEKLRTEWATGRPIAPGGPNGRGREPEPTRAKRHQDKLRAIAAADSGGTDAPEVGGGTVREVSSEVPAPVDIGHGGHRGSGSG